MEDAPLANEFITSAPFQVDEISQFSENEIIIDSNLSEVFGVGVGSKLSYKKLYYNKHELKFQSGKVIKLEPAPLILFSDGTFRFTRTYFSEMYTRFQRPRYTSRMSIRFHFKEGETILDSDASRWYVSCGSHQFSMGGSIDPRYYELINSGALEYNGSAYRC